MASLLWALTCQRVITDRDTNSVSYIDGVEAFGVPKIPFRFPPFYVAMLWRRESTEDDLRTRVQMSAPNGKELLSFEPEIQKDLHALRHRINILLGGMPIDLPGVYTIRVQGMKNSKWHTHRSLQIEVSLAKLHKS